MRRPMRIPVLGFEPVLHRDKFFWARRESNAVIEINAAIAEREQFGAQKVLPAETTEVQGRAGERVLHALLPIERKVVD